MPTIEFDGVVKRYGDVVALAGIDITVETGQFHCLLGPNGSGKTTLFSLLLELTRPTAGRIYRPDGTVGVSFQRPTFYPDLTVEENIAVFGRMAPPPSEAWKRQLIDVLELDQVDARRAGDLSGGWQKKLDLALAFLKRPTFAVLDEPLDDLDDVTKHNFRQFLAEYPDDDHGLLIATHHVGSFEAVLDRLTVIDQGGVQYDGPIDNGVDARDRYLELVEQ